MDAGFDWSELAAAAARAAIVEVTAGPPCVADTLVSLENMVFLVFGSVLNCVNHYSFAFNNSNNEATIIHLSDEFTF